MRSENTWPFKSVATTPSLARLNLSASICDDGNPSANLSLTERLPISRRMRSQDAALIWFRKCARTWPAM